MAFEQRDNSGAIFKNERKEKDTQPNMTGSAMIEGVMYFVSAWTKEGAKGRFQSLSFKRQDEKPAQKPKEREPGSFDDFEDSIPF